MKTSKQLIALSIATSLTLTPLAVSANSEKGLIDMVSINAEVINEGPEELVAEYSKYTGKIVEITEKEELISILVKDGEEEFNGEVLHLNKDVIILNSKTKENMKMEDLKEGMEITRFAHKNTPVLLSIPGQLTPQVIIVNEEATGSFDVSKFDEDLVNSENTLKLNIEEEKTIMVNETGEKVEKEDLVNRDLVVFYSVATKSIPAQAAAQKIILLDERQEPEIEESEEVVEEADEEVEDKQAKIQALDKIIINDKEISLDKELYSKDGIIMIPLRQISEALGYEVTWNNETRTSELTKGAQWTAVTLGEDNYNFAKMLVKLGSAPEINGGSTFVPFTFLEEVLKVNVEITESGMINITE